MPGRRPHPLTPAVGASSVQIVTNSFIAAGGDNYPIFEDAPVGDKVNLGLGYEQALLAYILSFPEEGGLPTIPDTDPRYVDPRRRGPVLDRLDERELASRRYEREESHAPGHRPHARRGPDGLGVRIRTRLFHHPGSERDRLRPARHR